MAYINYMSDRNRLLPEAFTLAVFHQNTAAFFYSF